MFILSPYKIKKEVENKPAIPPIKSKLPYVFEVPFNISVVIAGIRTSIEPAVIPSKIPIDRIIKSMGVFTKYLAAIYNSSKTL